jgi:CheY-like chemotaxis protein
MRQLIARFLEAAGIPRPTEAETGEQALELFAQGQFDLVLTDWHLQGISGLEVLSKIRSKNPKLPVIIMTTEAGEDHRQQAEAAGVTDYLMKPFDTKTRQRLLKHCRQQRNLKTPSAE